MTLKHFALLTEAMQAISDSMTAGGLPVAVGAKAITALSDCLDCIHIEPQVGSFVGTHRMVDEAMQTGGMT